MNENNLLSHLWTLGHSESVVWRGMFSEKSKKKFVDFGGHLT